MTPEKIYREYESGVSYNNRIGLYEQVKKNENFYIGKQWEGLNAPDLNKPVINILKRVVSYFISMIVSDDVGVSITPNLATDNDERTCRVLEKEVEAVFEQANLKDKFRHVIRDAAVDGDGYLYFYYDPDKAENGGICAESVDNVNVIFHNPYSQDLQGQRHILIVMKKSVEAVRDEKLRFTGDERGVHEDSLADGLCTVILKLYKKNGTVHAIKVTRDAVIRPEWDTGLKMYPISSMCWERVKNSYHGMAAITSAIPNQISINQLFAMAVHSTKLNAFPKIIFDRTKLKSWSNKIGQAIGVAGNPNDAVVSSFRVADMSPQVMELIQVLIKRTIEYMGASDASLGNVTPDNTSAIIATQKASALPLELQKLEFYSFCEECVRIIADIISVNYGRRRICIENEPEEIFDFSLVNNEKFNMKVDIGSAAYWSEIMQVNTLDNLFEKGIIPDAESYLESIPSGYISGKNKLLGKIKAVRENAEI